MTKQMWKTIILSAIIFFVSGISNLELRKPNPIVAFQAYAESLPSPSPSPSLEAQVNCVLRCGDAYFAFLDSCKRNYESTRKTYWDYQKYQSCLLNGDYSYDMCLRHFCSL